MKFFYVLFLLFSPVFVFSQETISDKKKAFYDCKSNSCKITNAIKIAELYLEIDKIEEAQKWLDYSKKSLLKNPNDTLQYYSNSLQSELFYYMGLYQFGLHEAQKAIELGKVINDSLYLSNAFLLEGINWYEMCKLSKSEVSFHKAKNYFPAKTKTSYKRYKINKEYIYNDLAQLKIKTNQLDSSYFYNKKAYKFAKIFKDNRCIANVERTFGELFLKQNKKDSAQYYFDKSIETSLKASIYDTALLGYGNLVECFSEQPQKVNFYFEEGQDLIKKHTINAAFQKLFYAQSLKVFQSLEDKDLLLATQEKLLSIDNNINQNGNIYIQNITNQYINSENKLLLSKINELDKQKNIKILQLLAALFLALILLLVIIIIRRKNKLQKLLLNQKNEISKDLHDDIGSELSSILINTNLLKNYETNDNQKALIDKITNTSSEISQRLNTFIWTLNTDNNNVSVFCDYVKLYAHKFLEGTEIKLNFINDTDTISNKILDGSSRKNLFFCIKEALNNIVKHSGATEVIVTISSFEKRAFLITIHDNGKGLLETNKFGNGLINIKKRIANLKGNVKIDSNNGLIISIKIPF
ncbi:ATP-binding protein [Flavobacterium sp.]|uniref:sensor histidine kinase n=1 Tax=Flavobacterium sp. TaxID=239 RepID=UPI002617378C|nr:ATP-binding protein [Flavobacterium sp.]